MKNNEFYVPESNFDNPAFNGSMQKVLSGHIGNYVVCDFLIGTNNTVSKAGIIYAVCEKTIVLYEKKSQIYTLCDIFNIKFVSFPNVPAVDINTL